MSETEVPRALYESHHPARGYAPDEVKAAWRRMEHAKEERRAIEQAIERGRFGRLWSWDGSSEPTDERATALLHPVLAETGARLERAPHAL